MLNSQSRKEEMMILELSYEEIKASTNNFSLDRLIGKGSHGSVYKGHLLLLKSRDDDHDHQQKQIRAVAIKKPSPSSPLQSTKLDNEIRILSSVHSPYIVNLLGVAHVNATQKLLVSELMPNGSLHDLLHNPMGPPPTWHRRMRIALQVARAIHVLHRSNPPVIHRDVKSTNILFDGQWNARLADFSLAVTWRKDHGDDDISILPAGTLGYLDPGYTDAGRLGPANDVYSFGVVLMELVSGRKVVDVERDPAGIVEWLGPRVRRGEVGEVVLGFPVDEEEEEEVVARILRLAVGCVEEEEGRRPTIGEVVEELREVVVLRRSWGWRVCRRWLRGWRRWKERRVMMTTRKIVCKDHLDDVREN